MHPFLRVRFHCWWCNWPYACLSSYRKHYSRCQSCECWRSTEVPAFPCGCQWIVWLFLGNIWLWFSRHGGRKVSKGLGLQFQPMNGFSAFSEVPLDQPMCLVSHSSLPSQDSSCSDVPCVLEMMLGRWHVSASLSISWVQLWKLAYTQGEIGLLLSITAE